MSVYSKGLIKEAILRELKRGGQVFFLHNSVRTIEYARDRLEEILPDARIEIAHGQMPERDLEKVMKSFYQGRFHILVCTTIIETGIDIPNANTIIIERADKFGLAQLHQLRGRVGRSHHQAYAYLLVPHEDNPRSKATKRLEAVQSMDELGAGFFLAIQDMEIRGAGEVLGDAQSGEIKEIGFTLYCDMLDTAIKALQKSREPNLLEPFEKCLKINLHTPAILPETYCRNVHQRLILYKRLSNCETIGNLSDLVEEITDRFGLPPDPVKTLIWNHEIRITARDIKIEKIDVGAEKTVFYLPNTTNLNPDLIIEIMKKEKTLSFSGPNKIQLTTGLVNLKEKVQKIKALLELFAG